MGKWAKELRWKNREAGIMRNLDTEKDVQLGVINSYGT